MKQAWAAPGQASRATRGLNFKSHIPLYIQLTEILKERIETGEWEPGQRFASEGEIGAEFGVSRAVVRPALAILESDGQLVKAKGRGIFVSPAKVFYRFDGLVRNLLDPDPRRASCRIVDITDDTVNDRLAAALDITPECDRLTHIMSVVLVDQQPIAIRDSYLSPLIRADLLAYLSSSKDFTVPLALPHGLGLHSADAEIEVSSASPFESEELGISAGAPTILVTYRDFAASDATNLAPIEFARMAYRADITSFRIELR